MSEYETNKTHSGLRRPITYGQILLDARKRSNITIADVAKSINLTSDTVEAIEQSDNERLPSPAFVQGYIKSYAKYLGIAEDQVLEAYCKAVPHAPESKLILRADTITETNSRTPVVRAVSVLLVIVGFAALIYGAINYYREKADSIEGMHQTAQKDDSRMSEYVMPGGDYLSHEPSELPASDKSNATISTLNPLLQNESVNATDDYTDEQSVDQIVENNTDNDDILLDGDEEVEVSHVVETQEEPSLLTNEIALIQTQSVAAGEDTIKLVTYNATWVEIIDANKAKLYYELMPADTEISLQGTAPFDVFLGNAPSVNVIVNGVEVDATEHFRSNNTARYKVTVQDNQVIFF